MDSKTDRCVLCLEQKRHPAEIRCGHSFCRKCLQVYKSYNKYAWARRCPICRDVLQEKRRCVPDKRLRPIVRNTALAEVAVAEAAPSSAPASVAEPTVSLPEVNGDNANAEPNAMPGEAMPNSAAETDSGGSTDESNVPSGSYSVSAVSSTETFSDTDEDRFTFSGVRLTIDTNMQWSPASTMRMYHAIYGSSSENEITSPPPTATTSNNIASTITVTVQQQTDPIEYVEFNNDI